MLKKVIGLIFAFILTWTIIGEPISAQIYDVSGEVAAVETTEHDEGMDWGWLGLIGLAGLIGLKRDDKK